MAPKKRAAQVLEHSPFARLLQKAKSRCVFEPKDVQVDDDYDLSKELLAFALLLPKVELHAHLNGSISPQLINCLIEARSGPTDGMTGIASSAEPLLNAGNAEGRMKFVFGLFDTVYSVVTSAQATALAVQDLLLHYAAENTCYLEIRTSLRPLEGGVDPRGYLDTVCRAIKDVQDGGLLQLPSKSTENESNVEQRLSEVYDDLFKLVELQVGVAPEGTSRAFHVCEVLKKRIAAMKVNLLVSINRGRDPSAAEDSIKLIEDIFKTGTRSLHGVDIVGLDFCGNCYKNKFSDFRPCLERARKELGLRITLHAGEKRDDAELLEMVDFAPERYGHLVFTTDVAVAAIRKQNASVEICLSSNLATSEGDGKQLSNHHMFEDWFCFFGMLSKTAEQYPVTINTDDRGVFYTSMTREFLLLAHEVKQRYACAKSGKKPTDDEICRLLWTLSRRALDDAFMSKDKDRIREFSKFDALEYLA